MKEYYLNPDEARVEEPSLSFPFGCKLKFPYEILTNPYVYIKFEQVLYRD
jgi:hypothetical protein